MDFLKIGDGKILLTLSADDMTEFSGTRRENIRKLMIVLHEKYGCTELDGQIFVQMYESKNGGCEMFVTKLDDKGGNIQMMRQTDDRTVTEIRRYILRERRGIYSFAEMNDLLFACKLMKNSGYSGKSEVFYDDSADSFYLMLDEESVYPGEALGALCTGTTEYYLREHCRQIFGEHAAQLLAELV